MNYAKVILNCYPEINRAVNDMDMFIKGRCELSFYGTDNAYNYLDKIATIIENKRKLLILKKKIKNVLGRLSDIEMLIIKYKYFKKRPIEGFFYSTRSYYRYHNKALKHVEELLSFVGLKKEDFLRDYGNIPFIRSVISLVELEDEDRHLDRAA